MLQTKGHTFGALWQMRVAHKKPMTEGFEALNHLETLQSEGYCITITRNPSKLRDVRTIRDSLHLSMRSSNSLKMFKTCLSEPFGSFWILSDPFGLSYCFLSWIAVRLSMSQDSEVMTPWQLASRCQYSRPDVTNQLKSRGKWVEHSRTMGKIWENGE